MLSNLEKLKTIMKQTNTSQWELASHTKIPRWKIQLILQGRHVPDPDETDKIAKALKSSIKKQIKELDDLCDSID